MKKFTREQIEEIVLDAVNKMLQNTSEILLGNMDNCINKTDQLEDKGFANQINNVMIPVSTAYQMSVYTTEIILCKLLCEDENEKM